MLILIYYIGLISEIQGIGLSGSYLVNNVPVKYCSLKTARNFNGLCIQKNVGFQKNVLCS